MKKSDELFVSPKHKRARVKEMTEFSILGELLILNADLENSILSESL